MGSQRRAACRILYLLPLEKKPGCVGRLLLIWRLCVSQPKNRYFWWLITTYCKARWLWREGWGGWWGNWGGWRERHGLGRLGAWWNKRAVSRVRVRMKNENKRWPASPGEPASEEEMRREEREWKEWETAREVWLRGGAGWETPCRKWNWSPL